MFSKARRNSRAQGGQAPISPPPASLFSVRSESPALPSPLYVSDGVFRPSTADGGGRQSSLGLGPLSYELEDSGFNVDFSQAMSGINVDVNGTPAARSKEINMKEQGSEQPVQKVDTDTMKPSQHDSRQPVSRADIDAQHPPVSNSVLRTEKSIRDTPAVQTSRAAPAASSIDVLEPPPKLSGRRDSDTSTSSRNSRSKGKDRSRISAAPSSADALDPPPKLSTRRDSDTSTASRRNRLKKAAPVTNVANELTPPPKLRTDNDNSSVSSRDGRSNIIPVINVPGDNDNASIASRKSALRSQRSYEHFSRPRSTANPVPSSPRGNSHLALRDSSSSNSNIQTSYITQDPMFPRSASISPLVPKFEQSLRSSTSRESLDSRRSRRVASNGKPEHERKRKTGRAVSGVAVTTDDDLEPAHQSDSAQFESPKMEASMFPTYKPPTPVRQDPPAMDRSFIDSRDRPYSQAKPKRPESQASTRNFARPNYADIPPSPRSSSLPQPPPSLPPSSLGKPSIVSPSSTIGISFESTSAAFPAPQLVSTRPKNEGTVSTIAGVQVPTHHTSGLTSQASVSSKADRRMTKLLNPMALLRRKSAMDTAAVEDEERKALAVAQERQKTVATVGIDKVPEDFDPRIKGKIVHDFSAPRRREVPATMSPVVRVTSEDEPARHMPVFKEHFPDTPVQRVSGGIAAESRENKDFLARFSQQSSASTFSQESAILPPFARRSQNLDSSQAAHWRDEDGSWSSGRDSGGISSTGPDRESGISSFSAISPITRSSDMFSPVSPQLDRKERPRSHSESTAKQEELQKPPEPVSEHPRLVQKLSTAVGHGKRAGEVVKRKSTASGFSFQMDPDDGDQEKALEDKFRESGVFPPKKAVSVRTYDDEDDFFDEDAMNDMDEIELQMQDLEQTVPRTSVHPLDKSHGLYMHTTQPTVQQSAQINHEPTLQQAVLGDAAQTVNSPTNNPRFERSISPRQIIQESSQETTIKQSRPETSLPSPMTSTAVPSSVSERPRPSVDGFFYNGDIPYVSNERELTYAEHPVFQTHTALADSRRESFQSNFLDSYLAGSPTSPPRKDESRKGSLTGSSKSRQGSSSQQQPPQLSPLAEKTEVNTPIEHIDSAMGSLNRADSGTEKPRWGRTGDLWKVYKKEEDSDGQGLVSSQSFSQPRHRQSTVPAAARGIRVRKPTGSRQSRHSMASSRLESIRQRDEDLYFDDGRFDQDKRAKSSITDEAQIDQIGIVSQEPEHVDTPAMPGHMDAYHQALVEATNQAAAQGRFERKASVQDPPPIATPGKMAFDFGFDQDPDYDDLDDELVAAANAEALHMDNDNFYGSEFNFYARAKPGVESGPTNGGFYGEQGDDGLTRKRSGREPNLTPITERSDNFSQRSSYINLTSPALARMPVDAFSENDITTFEQLKKLRKDAFGGSQSSLGKSSPTASQMAFTYSNGSSSSGDRMSGVESSHSRTGSDVQKRRASALGQEVND